MSALAKPEPLPPKEQGIYKNLIKAYELKQFKRVLKLANQILANHNHPDTLAMKGLTLNVLDQREEALKQVREGLKYSKFQSHICWHVYGLILRGEKQYAEALKCYTQAIKLDAHNQQVLRELAVIQTIQKDLKGIVDTRRQLLELKPTVKPNWLSLVVALHSTKNYSQAIATVDTYEKGVGKDSTKFELSELRIYKSMLLLESGDANTALAFLTEKQAEIVDTYTRLEMMAKCYEKLERFDDARLIYTDLFKEQRDNKDYFIGWLRTHNITIKRLGADLTRDLKPKIHKFIKELEAAIGKSELLSRTALDTSSGEEFKERFSSYARKFIVKNVPALFSAFKTLYKDQEKVVAIDEISKSWEVSLRDSSKFDESGEVELPATYLWALLLRSSHFYRIKNYELALEYIEKALSHTPTVEMMHVYKGRILKHLKKPAEAWECMEKARLLDSSDRYLSTRASKYHLRNNKLKEADATAGMFITPSDDKETNVFNYMLDMQCMWYEIELGDLYFRTGDIYTAMKRWLLIHRHFNDTDEDFVDFQSYALRKNTLRSYVEGFRWSGRMFSHPTFLKAAVRIVKGYISIFDRPDEVKKPEEKKADEKKVEDGEDDEEVHEKKKPKPKYQIKGYEDSEDKAKSVEQQIKVELAKPLDAAVQFAESLSLYAFDSLSTHLWNAELYIRRAKPFLVLRHLLAGKALVKEDYDISDDEKTQFEGLFLRGRAFLEGFVKDNKDSEIVPALSELLKQL